MNSSSQALRPVKTGKTAAITRTIDFKVVGTSRMRSSLCTPQLALSTVVRSSVTKTVSKEAAVEDISSKTIHTTTRAQLHLPVHTSFLGSDLGRQMREDIITRSKWSNNYGRVWRTGRVPESEVAFEERGVVRLGFSVPRSPS